MTSRPNFTPIGESAASTRRLDIDFSEQHNLVSDILHTTSDFQESPSVNPEQTDVGLRGIRLLPARKGPAKLKPTMKVDYSINANGMNAAAIQILEGYRQAPTEYNLSNIINGWEELKSGSKKPIRYLDHHNLIDIISPRLRQKHILDELMDKATLSGIEVATMLAQYLEKSATTRIHRAQYVASDIIVSNQYQVVGNTVISNQYLGEVKTTLSTQQTNNRRIHTLSVSALSMIGMAEVEKKYAYKMASNPSGLLSAGGTITVSSDGGLSKHRLDAFAKADSEKSHPLDAFHQGLQTLADKYYL